MRGENWNKYSAYTSEEYTRYRPGSTRGDNFHNLHSKTCNYVSVLDFFRGNAISQELFLKPVVLRVVGSFLFP